MLARLTVRRGEYAEGLAMLESAMADLRGFGMEDTPNSHEAWIAEAEALGGDAMRALEVASERMRTNDRERPLLTRMAGVALARLGERKGAMRELEHALRTARDRGANYDIAATIDAMAAIDGADPPCCVNGTRSSAAQDRAKLPVPALGPQTRCEGHPRGGPHIRQRLTPTDVRVAREVRRDLTRHDHVDSR